MSGRNCSAKAIIEVLVDKSLITVSAKNTSLQMHELIQSMAREIVREKFDMPGNRLWISLEFHDSLSENKVREEVEVLVVLLKNGQKITVDGKAFTRMKNLRILKICSPIVGGLWQPFAVNSSGSLDFLSDGLRLFYWRGFPFKYLPSDFYPENIVAIDLSYSQIKHIWKTPKCFKSVHPSIGMLKRLVVLNLRDCKQLQNFPSRVEMDALQVLNLTGCLKVNQLPSIGGFNQDVLGSLLPIWFILINNNIRKVQKLEVLPELPPSVWEIDASDCTTLREVLGSSKDPFMNKLTGVNSSCKTVEDMERVLFSSAKSLSTHLNNFDGAYITKGYFKEFVKREMIGTQDSYMICLGYTRHTRKWKEAKNFVTFSVFEENNEDYEVKECGVRLICDEDIQQGADLSMLHGLPTPTQHGGMLNIYSGKQLVYN
ncbi:NB-ARC domains-containing protein [Tanacetum coccineum]|uniref:NB-ARC domains-containing protein n=1 Tax=Tanacetum coccineum TaxID=301880 RepID=A0ABQ5BZG5_9ASTR